MVHGSSLNCHSESISKANYFFNIMNGKKLIVIEQVNSGSHKEIVNNR